MPLKLDDGLQVGGSSLATQNFTLRTPTPPDGSVAMYRGNHGSEAGKMWEVDAQGNFKAKTINLGTPVAMAGKTFHDFPIPEGAKRVTVMLDNLSTTGAAHLLFQLGTDSAIQTSGYNSSSVVLGGGVAANGVSSGSGFVHFYDNTLRTVSGSVAVQSMGSADNTWLYSGVTLPFDVANYTYQSAGRKPAAGTPTRVRLTTVNGTDQFDAGTANISWEY